MGETVGALIQLTISQSLSIVNRGHGVRLSLGPRFEQIVDGLVLWIATLCRVEIHQQLLTLGTRQNGQRVERG